MARTHSRTSLSVWVDEDWLALPMHAQWCYDMLKSQSEINHAGLLTLAPRRWADLCSNQDPDLLDDALKILADRNYIVIDEDTQQLLVRSFIRGDNVDKQPNTLKAACASILLVRSRKIRAVLLAELNKLDQGRIERFATTKGHARAIDVLRDTIDALAADQTPPPGNGRTTPSDGYASDPYASDTSPRTRAGDGEGEGVGESPVSPSVVLQLGESRQQTEIPDRCDRCSKLGLAPDDPGPDCRPCGLLRQARERQAARTAARQHEAEQQTRQAAADLAASCAASGRCDGRWVLEYPFGPPVEPARKCDHGLHLVHDQTG